MKSKKVNIYPRSPITAVNPPIRVPQLNVTKSIQDIRKCVIHGAKVEEVLPNGTVILLNLTNYDLDNSSDVKLDDSKPLPKIDFSSAKEAGSKVEDSKRNDVKVSTNDEHVNSPAPVVEHEAPIDVSISKDEQANITAIRDAVAIEDTTSVESSSNDGSIGVSMPEDDENKVEQRLTRRQRRALERMKAAEANKQSEEVKTDSVE